MKKILLAFIMMSAAVPVVAQWNNPIEQICLGEYQVVGTLGVGTGELQINRDNDTFGYASIGISPALGVWQAELRYSKFEDEGIDIDQYGVNFKVDFTLNCEVQCLYWMAGWNYAEFDVYSVRRNDLRLIVDYDGNDNYWNAGVGYRYRWTNKFDTSVEYNYNDAGRVGDFDMGHLRSLTVNFAYRFGSTY